MKRLPPYLMDLKQITESPDSLSSPGFCALIAISILAKMQPDV